MAAAESDQPGVAVLAAVLKDCSPPLDIRSVPAIKLVPILSDMADQGLLQIRTDGAAREAAAPAPPGGRSAPVQRQEGRPERSAPSVTPQTHSPSAQILPQEGRRESLPQLSEPPVTPPPRSVPEPPPVPLRSMAVNDPPKAAMAPSAAAEDAAWRRDDWALRADRRHRVPEPRPGGALGTGLILAGVVGIGIWAVRTGQLAEGSPTHEAAREMLDAVQGALDRSPFADPATPAAPEPAAPEAPAPAEPTEVAAASAPPAVPVVAARAAAPPAAAAPAAAPGHAVAGRLGATVRNKPREGARITAYLGPGALLAITSAPSEGAHRWFRTVVNGHAGFVREDVLEFPQDSSPAPVPHPLSAPAARTVTTMKEGATLRSSPSMSAPVLQHIPGGVVLETTGIARKGKPRWLRVRLGDGRTGFVREDMIRSPGRVSL